MLDAVAFLFGEYLQFLDIEQVRVPGCDIIPNFLGLVAGKGCCRLGFLGRRNKLTCLFICSAVETVGLFFFAVYKVTVIVNGVDEVKAPVPKETPVCPGRLEPILPGASCATAKELLAVREEKLTFPRAMT